MNNKSTDICIKGCVNGLEVMSFQKLREIFDKMRRYGFSDVVKRDTRGIKDEMIRKICVRFEAGILIQVDLDEFQLIFHVQNEYGRSRLFCIDDDSFFSRK